MAKKLRGFISDIIYFFCNYVVAYIPFWCIRKLFYRILGMKIGKGSRILMHVTVVTPWRITLGERVYVNEYCYLDGRGGIEIGDDASISIYSLINTGLHELNSVDFVYAQKKVVIGDHVWIGARANVLGGGYIGSGCVICAGSTVKSGTYEALGIYSGTPAVKIGVRDENAIGYKQGTWKPWFR